MATLNSPFYLAVWIADDSADCDNDPNIDGGAPVAPHASNSGAGVLTLRAEAFGPAGTHRVIEATIARTAGTDPERGYTGQRGQDEQGSLGPKAPVGMPGTGLGRSEMSLGGGLVTQ